MHVQKILAAFHLDDPASLKRALAIALGGLAVLTVNPFLSARGLPPVSDTALELVAGLVATFVLQSGFKSAVIGKVTAEVEGVARANAAATASLAQPPTDAPGPQSFVPHGSDPIRTVTP